MSIKNAIRDPPLGHACRFKQEYELERPISLLPNDRNEANPNALSGRSSYSISNRNEDAQQDAVADRHQLRCFTPTTLQPRRRLGLALAPKKNAD